MSMPHIAARPFQAPRCARRPVHPRRRQAGLAWGWALGLLAGAAFLVTLAWVLTNLKDAPARPRPPELLADPSPLPRGEGVAALAALATPRLPASLAQACAPALSCVNQWLQQAPGELQPDAEAAALGARCDALIDSPWRYREAASLDPVVPSLHTEFPAARACLRWFTRESVRQLRGGQMAAVLPPLRRALHLARTLQAGSDGLAALAQANRLVVEAHEVVLALVLRAPALASALQPMLAEPGHAPADAVAATRRWVVHESAFGAAQLAQLVPPPCQAGGWLPLACWRHLGFQAQRTQQAFDDRWMALWRRLDAGWLPTLQRAQATQAASAAALADGFPAWRNTSGKILVQVAADAYIPHLLRQADARLHREATALVVALQVQGVPAGERAAWAARQPLSDELRQRLVWSPDGQHLRVSNWTTAARLPPAPAFSARWPG